jgi:hypothetical protein
LSGCTCDIEFKPYIYIRYGTYTGHPIRLPVVVLHPSGDESIEYIWNYKNELILDVLDLTVYLEIWLYLLDNGYDKGKFDKEESKTRVEYLDKWSNDMKLYVKKECK